MRILLCGHRGWLGQAMQTYLKAHEIYTTEERLETADQCTRLITRYIGTVDRVVCCIGRTHGRVSEHLYNSSAIDTIDYLEDHPDDNMRDNCTVPLALALACASHGLHMTYLGTGCLFTSRPDQPPVTTDAVPTFTGSAYSRVKGLVDQLMHQEPLASCVLNVRLRMPFVAGRNRRNFHSKVYAYRHRLASVANSVSVIDTLFPLLVNDIVARRVGTVHLVNPGYVTHEQILDAISVHMGRQLDRQLVTQSHVDMALKAPRSNTILESSYPMATPADQAVAEFCQRVPV